MPDQLALLDLLGKFGSDYTRLGSLHLTPNMISLQILVYGASPNPLGLRLLVRRPGPCFVDGSIIVTARGTGGCHRRLSLSWDAFHLPKTCVLLSGVIHRWMP